MKDKLISWLYIHVYDGGNNRVLIAMGDQVGG